VQVDVPPRPSGHSKVSAVSCLKFINLFFVYFFHQKGKGRAQDEEDESPEDNGQKVGLLPHYFFTRLILNMNHSKSVAGMRRTMGMKRMGRRRMGRQVRRRGKRGGFEERYKIL
jgi:hypothetical protein